MTSDPGSWLSLPKVPDLPSCQEPADRSPGAKGEITPGMIKVLEKKKSKWDQRSLRSNKVELFAMFS